MDNTRNIICIAVPLTIFSRSNNNMINTININTININTINIGICSTCGSGKKYKNCCGK